MTALAGSTREADAAATIDAVRRAPERRDELVALLPESAPLYDGRTSAEVTRLRGYILAAFADTGLPATALPYVLEALESGHMPYEVAGAAIALRGLERPGAQAVPYLLSALRNLSGMDAAVSFERYDPRWPYAQPTTALTEVLRTIAGLGADAAGALPELERRLAQPARDAPELLAEMESAVEAIRGAEPSGCCHHTALEDRLEHEPADGAVDVTLEDQDGRAESFAAFFSGKPSVVAFFYTRCDNPYKCSLTVTRLAQVQALLRERGLAGAVRLAAITYDPGFDTAARLERYGLDRGFSFGDDARFFRTTAGFGELARCFGLQVNYGPSTVNRHRLELHVLDARGDVAASFTRLQWQPADVVEAACATRPGCGSTMRRRPQSGSSR